MRRILAATVVITLSGCSQKIPPERPALVAANQRIEMLTSQIADRDIASAQAAKLAAEQAAQIAALTVDAPPDCAAQIAALKAKADAYIATQRAAIAHKDAIISQLQAGIAGAAPRTVQAPPPPRATLPPPTKSSGSGMGTSE